MPKLLYARPPRDETEERKICKLAGARHAPADGIRRAQMIIRSWAKDRVPQIAAALGCHSQTVASVCTGSTPKASMAWVTVPAPAARRG